MAQRITDLEEFALRHVWRPYQTMMGHEETLQSLPMSLEETAALLTTDKSGWADCVLDRIAAIGFTFPAYISHPLVDVVRAAITDRAPVRSADPSPAVVAMRNIDHTDDRDWTDHTIGEECPVTAGTLIDVMDADGYVWTGVKALDESSTAAQFWTEDWGGLSISKWRLAE